MKESWADGEKVVAERRWTKPTPACPHPERWHTTGDGMGTEFEVIQLVAGMVAALQPTYAIETGAHVGLAAFAMGRVLTAGWLVSLEIDEECVATARVRCAALPVEVLHMSSLDYTPEQLIDFAWFDSDVPLRVKEFVRFWPWMHSRTVVGFHDTGQDPTSSYLDPLVEADILRPPLYLPTPRGVAFARLGDGEPTGDEE